MTRLLDHLVIPSRDLDAQSEFYRRMGFRVGARNQHPWGTENHIVQFDGAFLELIGLGPHFVTPIPTPKEFSFAGFVDRYLQTREGLAMMVMRSSNAEADRLKFSEAGIGDFSRFDFARQGVSPSGEPVNVAFSLAFAASLAWRETGFFVCQQHYPENFWNHEAQIHPNGVYGIAEVSFTHPQPEEGREFLRLFFDARPRPERGGYSFDLDGSSIEVRRGADAAMTGVTFKLKDLPLCVRALQAGGVPYAMERDMVALTVESPDGVTFTFLEA